jgi:hypothetical protein
VTGTRIKDMAKAQKYGSIQINMKALGSLIKDRELALFSGRTAAVIKGGG